MQATEKAGFVEYDSDGRRFRPGLNSEAGEVNVETVLTYHENDGIAWAEYSGGPILRSVLITTKSRTGELDMRCVHLNQDAQFMSGVCHRKYFPVDAIDCTKVGRGRVVLVRAWRKNLSERSEDG